MLPRLVTLVIATGLLQAQPPQQVEGFASIIHDPGAKSRPGPRRWIFAARRQDT